MNELDIDKAWIRIKEDIYQTKVTLSEKIGEIVGANVFLKHENQQLTGSFKIRGALNKLNSLLHQEPFTKKVVAASTGNHAAAIAYAAWKHGVEAIIFAPKSISKAKLENLQKQNIDLRLYGEQSYEAEIFAKEFANENNLPFIHPYNDLEVISGQGTIAVELLQQLNGFDAVFVPIGGGGLISGIASYLKKDNPQIKIIGCQPENASEMHDSIINNGIVQASKQSTISDGTAGGLDPNTVTFEICKKYVDEIVLVSEEDIVNALYLLFKYHNMKIEPAAALSVASIIKHAKRLKTNKNVVILSGSKITDAHFQSIISKFIS